MHFPIHVMMFSHAIDEYAIASLFHDAWRSVKVHNNFQSKVIIKTHTKPHVKTIVT